MSPSVPARASREHWTEPNGIFHGYDPRVFGALRELLAMVTVNWSAPAPRLLAQVQPVEARAFLEQQGLARVWPRFQEQHAQADALVAAFHRWFDGLATFRFVRHLTETKWSQIDLLEAWHGLNELRGDEARQ